MPLIANSDLPTFAALKQEGADVIIERSPDRPILNIGLLNLTPDAVLEPTERQFMRLVAGYAEADVYVFPFTVAAEHRGDAAQTHIEQHYQPFASVQRRGLDALIVTGANPQTDNLVYESFWRPMVEVVDWAQKEVSSILCSCLAVQAAMLEFFDTPRIRLPNKCWGVYPHQVLDVAHPLVQGVEQGVTAPHSHIYEISREQIEQAGGRVLIHSDQAGVYLAVGEEGSPFVFFQGHPEYDVNSLLKEYKREVWRCFDGARTDYPPLPENYFPAECLTTLERFKQQLLDAKHRGQMQPAFPEPELTQALKNCWAVSGERLFHNWLRQVQQSSHRVIEQSIDVQQ
jgi:homoserine O-succinyltransferase